MSPGGLKTGSSMSMDGPPDGIPEAAARRSRRSSSRHHTAQAFLQEPQATDVAQEAGAVVDTCLVGEVGPTGVVGEHGPVQLEPDQRPRAAGDIGEPVGGGRHGDDRRSRVVRADGCHGHARGGQPPTPARGLNRGKELVRDPDPVEQLGGPVQGVDVEQPGGRGVGDLTAQLTREPVGEKVRDERDARVARGQYGPRRSAASW